MREAALLMLVGALAAVLAMAAAFYAASGKPDSDPEITRAMPVAE